jgi:hypothetical protein
MLVLKRKKKIKLIKLMNYDRRVERKEEKIDPKEFKEMSFINKYLSYHLDPTLDLLNNHRSKHNLLLNISCLTWITVSLTLLKNRNHQVKR